MSDTKTTGETTKSPLDGSELIRLATSGANWKTSIEDMFASGTAPALGIVDLQHAAFGSYAEIDVATFAPGGPEASPISGPFGVIINDFVSGNFGDISGALTEGVTIYTGYRNDGPGAASIYAIEATPTVNGDSVGPLDGHQAGYFEARNYGTGALALIRGLEGRSRLLNSTSVTISNALAGFFQLQLNGPATISQAGALQARIIINQPCIITSLATFGDVFGTSITNSSAITNLYGCVLPSPTISGGTTVTNAYGISVGDYSGVGSSISYNVYSAGANSLNVFEGEIDVKLVKYTGGNTSGAGSALLGTNSPAVTNTAPYTWITAKAADNSTVYIPAWK